MSRATNIQLTGYDIGDETISVFIDHCDLARRAILLPRERRQPRIERADDCRLFGERRERETVRPELVASQMRDGTVLPVGEGTAVRGATQRVVQEPRQIVPRGPRPESMQRLLVPANG